jgi:ComF family protein
MPVAWIRDFLLELKDDVLDFVYPQSCPICQKPLGKKEKEVCEDCWGTLAILPAPFCPYCKSFLEESSGILKHVCPSLGRPGDGPIAAVRSLGIFDDHYQELIHRFKYGKKIPLGKRLAHRLGEVVVQEKDFAGCDLILSVPLHRARYRERGFNQSEIVAEGISRVTGIPILQGVLKRKKNTRDQTYLNAQQRAENVKDAFVMGQLEKVKNKKVILVDDVTTTGATLNECARMLHRAGAETIFAATLAVVVD